MALAANEDDARTSMLMMNLRESRDQLGRRLAEVSASPVTPGVVQQVRAGIEDLISEVDLELLQVQ